MILNLTTMSENNDESTQIDKKRGQQNEQFVMDIVMHYQAFIFATLEGINFIDSDSV